VPLAPASPSWFQPIACWPRVQCLPGLRSLRPPSPFTHAWSLPPLKSHVSQRSHLRSLPTPARASRQRWRSSDASEAHPCLPPQTCLGRAQRLPRDTVLPQYRAAEPSRHACWRSPPKAGGAVACRWGQSEESSARPRTPGFAAKQEGALPCTRRLEWTSWGCRRRLGPGFCFPRAEAIVSSSSADALGDRLERAPWGHAGRLTRLIRLG
jgi:hypothetical protein